jgi:hypothetical protein
MATRRTRICGIWSRWDCAYGFFEAADYTAGRKRFGAPRFELVREWMPHVF